METYVYSATAGCLSDDFWTVSPRPAFREKRAAAADREIAAMAPTCFSLDTQILLREDQVSWLQDVLDSAAAENLCVRFNCTTCASHEFEFRLLHAAEQASRGPTAAIGWAPCAIVFVANALADLPYINSRDEPAIRLIIWRMYRSLGEQAFARDVASILYPSEAGRVLRSMERHHEAAQRRRGLRHPRSSFLEDTPQRAGTLPIDVNRALDTEGET